MVKASKYVADEIAALLDPNPVADFDPDGDGFMDDGARVFAPEDGEEALDQDALRTRRKRMAGELDEVTQRYPTKRTTRAQWEAQFGAGGAKPKRKPQAAAVEESEDEGEEDDDDDDDDADIGDEARSDGGAEGASSDSEEEEEEDGDGADAGGGSQARVARKPAAATAQNGARGLDSDEPDALRAAWAELDAEEASLAQQLQQQSQRELKRAREASAQRAAWEQVFNVRILLHKALACANRLPEPELLREGAAHTREHRSAHTAAAEEALGLCADLLALSRSLRNGERADDDEAEPQSHAGDLDARVRGAWQQTEAHTSALLPDAISSLDEWAGRAGLADTGGAGGSGKQFKAFHRNIGQQVEAVLADSSRLISRAHTIRTGALPLGYRRAAQQQAVAGAGGDGAAAGASAGEGASSVHVYDDTDLYHAQLKVRAAPAAPPRAGAAPRGRARRGAACAQRENAPRACTHARRAPAGLCGPARR